jgi:hypothetical protein
MPAWSKVVVSGSSAVLSSLALDTDLAVAHGGTGASTLTSGYALLGNGTSAPQMINSTADSTLLVGNGSTMVAETGATLRTSIGIAIGSDVQAYDAQLADVAGLAVTDSGFIVGNGSNFVLETGNTLRTSMGVGTGNSPTFTNLYTSGNISGSAASTGSFGRVQASVIGGNSPIRIEGAVTYADDASIDFGSINMTNLDVDSGTIDGATIATSDITVGSGKTLNVSAGTLTLAANQISGDKVEGGTIAATTITTLTATDVNTGNIDGILGADTARAITGTTITANTGIVPDANDGAYLGQGGTGFSDLYLANLGEIDWNNGQVAIKNLTHGDQYALLVGGSGTITSLAVTGHVTASNHIKALGDIYALGDVVAYYSSDERLKDNLQVIEGSLDKIGQISGYEFDWNEDAPGWAKERGHDVGVIAQEVQKVLPEVVQERKNGYLGVDYKRIVPLLIESIKELKEEVEILKKKVN